MKRAINKWGLWITIILALTLMLSPMMARNDANHPAVPLGESYKNIRLAGDISKNPLMAEDSQNHTEYKLNAYHYFLAAFLFLGDKIILTSIILSILTLYFLYAALRKLGTSKDKTILFLGVYVLSPIFIKTSATLVQETLIAFLAAASLYLYANSKKYESHALSGLSLAPSVLISLVDPASFLAFIFLFFITSYYTKTHYIETLIPLTMSSLLLGAVKYFTGLSPEVATTTGYALRTFLTDFGAITGYSFFILLLTVVNVIFLWRTGVRRKLLDISLLLATMISMKFPGTWTIMNILLCVYASLTISYFTTRRWAMPVLKDLTLLLLWSSLLFSAVSYDSRLADAEPLGDTVKVLDVLREDRRTGMVLTHPRNLDVVSYYSEKPVFNVLENEGIEEYNTIMNSKSPKETKSLLNSNNITYFYMDEQMLENPQNQGLLLVLDVSDNFIKRARFNGREAWLYIRI